MWLTLPQIWAPARPVPIELEVEVVPIGRAAPDRPVVVGQVACARALDVRQRIHREDLLRDRIDPVGRIMLLANCCRPAVGDVSTADIGS